MYIIKHIFIKSFFFLFIAKIPRPQWHPMATNGSSVAKIPRPQWHPMATQWQQESP